MPVSGLSSVYTATTLIAVALAGFPAPVFTVESCLGWGGDRGVGDAGLERVLEGVPRAGEWRSCGDLGRQMGVEFGQGWVDDPRVGLGEKDGQSASSLVSS